MKRHPYSIVVILNTLPKNDKTMIQFLEQFKESSMEFNQKKHIYKFKKLFKLLIIRFPIKQTDDLNKINQVEKTFRDTVKLIDHILDFNNPDNKYYVKTPEEYHRFSLMEKNFSNAENKKAKLEKKKEENYDPLSDIYYATQKDIDKVRFELGDPEFKYRIKHNIPLFPPFQKIHYDNDHLYKTYVLPYERGKKK